MTDTQAVIGYGTTFTWNGQVVAQLTSIGIPGVTLDMDDGTTFDSPDAFKEKIAKMLEAGTLKLGMHLYPGDTNGQMAMITDLYARTKREFIITLPAALAWSLTCDGFCSKFSPPDITPEGKIILDMEVTPTGKPTIASTASGGLTGLTGIEENAGAALDFIPNFLAGTVEYNVAVNTASTYIKLTPTAASHTITIDNGTSEQTVTSGAQSGEIDLGAANSVTTITITAQETGKVAQKTVIHVARP